MKPGVLYLRSKQSTSLHDRFVSESGINFSIKGNICTLELISSGVFFFNLLRAIFMITLLNLTVVVINQIYCAGTVFFALVS